MATAKLTRTTSHLNVLDAVLVWLRSVNNDLNAPDNDPSMASISSIRIILNSIGSPHQRCPRKFVPGRPLWFFVLVFLPLFVSLGVWQLNRASDKEQLLAQDATLVDPADIETGQPPVNRQSEVSGRILPSPIFLLDNKTRDGQFGYEVFALAQTRQGQVILSLGWLEGSPDRRRLPVFELPPAIAQQTITWRLPPTNPVLSEDANTLHSAQADVWVVQHMTVDWIRRQTGETPLGFAQLNDAEAAGVGPVIWQPTVMTPSKHRAYAVQWFAMAIALMGMFVYAGFRHSTSESADENNNKRGKRQ